FFLSEQAHCSPHSPPLPLLSLLLSFFFFLISTMLDSSSSAPINETGNHASGQLSKPATPSAGASQQYRKIRLQAALRQFLDFPIPGIDFIDILPLFADPALHVLLIECLA